MYGGYWGGDVDILPAPQMHEIEPCVKKEINGKDLVPIHYRSYNNEVLLALDYIDLDEGIDYASNEINVEGFKAHHYAEAYALLYLKLKQARLLEKEVNNENA